MRILTAGGAGFIGSNFIYYMLGKYDDCKITCLDALTYAANINTLKPLFNDCSFSFVKGDIRDRELVNKIFSENDFEIVVNFAAHSHVDRSIETPAVFLETNILGTQVLLDAARKYGIKRYHQVSTDEVDGELPLYRADLKFSEEDNLSTSSPYSASKAGADLLVEAYQKTYKLPASISRSSNNYGPYQHPEKLIPLMTVKALNAKKLPVYGDGRNIRDWLHVKDHCRALDKIIKEGQPGEIYNIGGQNEKSNLEIVKLILAELGRSEELIEFVEDRPGHDLRYAVDTAKIERELGWQPKIKFEEGLKKTIKWYIDNQEWWNNF